MNLSTDLAHQISRFPFASDELWEMSASRQQMIAELIDPILHPDVCLGCLGRGLWRGICGMGANELWHQNLRLGMEIVGFWGF